MLNNITFEENLREFAEESILQSEQSLERTNSILCSKESNFIEAEKLNIQLKKVHRKRLLVNQQGVWKNNSFEPTPSREF